VTDEARFWVSTPGSEEPPAGPFSKADVLVGRYPETATVCRVGESTWQPIRTLVTPSAGPTNPAETVPSKHTPEASYTNLTAAGTGTVGYGTGLKGLGWLVGVVGIFVVIGKVADGAMFAAAGGTLILAGIGFHIVGTLVAAVGEAMLALRDVAVNTRLSADAEARRRA